MNIDFEEDGYHIYTEPAEDPNNIILVVALEGTRIKSYGEMSKDLLESAFDMIIAYEKALLSKHKPTNE